MKRIVRFLTLPVDAEGNRRSGIIHLGTDIYDCEDRADLLGGTILGEGRNRYRDLIATDKQKCMISRVTRVISGQPREVHTRIVDAAIGDVVLETNIVPHKWAGES